MATLSQCLQCIILCIYQYRVYITYKPDPKLFIADWLSWHNHEENKDKDMRPQHKCQCNRDSSGPASLYINMQYTRSDSKRYTPTRARGIYHKGLVTQKRRHDTRHTNVLAHQTWAGHDRWHGHKKQVNNNTISIADADIETAMQQPHGNWEDKIACSHISALGKYKCLHRKSC